MKVSEIMRHPVVTVRESDSIEYVANVMLQNDYRGLPVVDKEDKIAGFISVSDFMAKEKGFPFSRFRGLQLFGKWIQADGVEQIYEDARNLTVDKIMSSPAYTVGDDDTVEELVDLMVKYGFSRMPVVHHKVPVGIVGRFNLLKLICSSGNAANGENNVRP